MPSWRMVWRRLDEGAPDVGVLDQALPVRDAGLLRVPDRRRRAGLGHRDDQVGLDRVLARPAGGPSRPGPRARRGRRSWCPGGRGRRTRRRSPWARPAAKRLRAQAVARRSRSARRARPRGPGLAPTMSSAAVSLATTQPRSSRPSTSGPDAVRVAGGVQGVLVHEDEAEGAAQVRQHLQRGGLEGLVRVAGQQRGDQGGVGGVAAGQLAAGPASPYAGRRPGRAARRCWSGCRCGPARRCPVAVAPRVGWAFSQVDWRRSWSSGSGRRRGGRVSGASAASSKTWETRPMSL